MKILRLFLLVLLLIISINSYAASRIDVTKGNLEPMIIAINNFNDIGQDMKFVFNEIAEIISADLSNTGLFKLTSKLPEKHVKQSPHFTLWQALDVTAMIDGDIELLDTGKILLKCRIWDIFATKNIRNLRYEFDKKKLRIIAHQIADEIYKIYTGEDGYFNTKIAFIAEEGSFIAKKKKLAIMDQDGKNLKYLTDGKHLVLTPRFAPDGKKILYLSYEQKIPQVFQIDLSSKQKKLIGKFPGMSFAPRFSPNGKKALISFANNGRTHIYEINLANLDRIKLTKGNHINTSPSYAPDGKKIVFSSDRSGKAQLYIMENNGHGVKRLSFGLGSYHTPVWSPRGDFIAFTKILGRNFHIGVVRPDGSGERILTHGFMVESPDWSTNGRIIIFTRKDKEVAGKKTITKLQSIDLTGYNEREMHLSIEASDPSWSKKTVFY